MSAPTRTRILDYLTKNPSATADQLARALQMTGANVRHHLAILKAEGQVVLLGQRSEGKGRPVCIYMVSDGLRGDGSSRLAEAMLAAWLQDARAETREALLQSLARALSGPSSPGEGAGSSHRLVQAVDRLNDLHYQARWEAGAAGARVILGHCPYAGILDRHPELCRLDAYLLEAQTGLTARQTAKLVPGKDGIRRCSFLVV